MRPVRFVALSEDGQAMVLADEVGRLLALPIDERVVRAARGDRTVSATPPTADSGTDEGQALSPRDIQARIRAGESADEVARIAGVPVDRVLRYAGPVLQERAMLAQYARRTRLRTSDRDVSLAELVDSRLAAHGVEAEKISWDAYRREDGTWRIVATWPSGKSTAQAIWELDKTRQMVTPQDDMAQYLCAERPSQQAGAEMPIGRGGHGLPGPTTRSEPSRGGHEPMRPPPDTARRESRTRDPIRAGRDALLASLERPLGASRAANLATPIEAPRQRPVSGGAAALLGTTPSAFDDDGDHPREVPAVPSLAVLRPRRSTSSSGEAGSPDRPRKRLPSWDDVLFGPAPAARDSS